MREITYKEILENIDCGLVVFFEDDFVQPDTVEICDILHKAIRMDENLQSNMLSLLDVVDKPFSSALKAFLELCKPAVDDVSDWTQIADVEDILSQYKDNQPELADAVDAALGAITSVPCGNSLPLLFQFGLHCTIPSKYQEIFSEYIEAESRWQPFVVFDNYNTDIATQVESLIKNIPDPNNTVTCIIDNSIRGENRANEIIDELERICPNATQRIVGAVVTSNDPIERIGETLFIEYVSKADIDKLKQALLRSAYHYLLRMLKDQLSGQVVKAFEKASSHRNIAIYLASAARYEGVSNYEVLMHWISAICEVGLSSSYDTPKLVAIANMLDACEESPDFEDMEDMSDINTHEAFDYGINRFYQPVAPGDIFLTSDGNIYILVGQACDMMMSDERDRRNGLCELVKANAVPLKWKEKTVENLTNVWINNFTFENSTLALKIDYQHRYFMDNEVISLCSYNTEGVCRINTTNDLSVDCLRMLQPYQIRYYSELQDYFKAIHQIYSSETTRPLFDVICADKYTSRIIKASDYEETDNNLVFGMKRIAHVKSHYYLYLYKLYLEYRGRLPFETINLARMQTMNISFTNGTTSVGLDIDIFIAGNKDSAFALPWIIKKDQLDTLIQTFASGNSVKSTKDYYLLDNEPLSLSLSNGRKLVLKKKARNSVLVQVNK